MIAPVQCGQCPGRFAAGMLRCPQCQAISPQFAAQTAQAPEAAAAAAARPAQRRARRPKPKAARQ